MVSDTSEATFSYNVYEEDLNNETTLDLSSMELDTLPSISKNILVLYLKNNKLRTLPDDFFANLPLLMYLDLRDNQLIDIPKSIANHQALTHLLLQNNCLTSLPNELGTVLTLKVLQLNGNPLMYPPKEILNKGVSEITKFLYEKYVNEIFSEAQSDQSTTEITNSISQEGISFNSVLDGNKMSIKFNEREDSELYGKIKGKCPKLDKSRHQSLPPYYQSAKYLKPLLADSKDEQNFKARDSYYKDVAIAKKKELLATREKIIQDRKDLENLKNWRKEYRQRQVFYPNRTHRLEPKNIPYDVNPEYMTFLKREDIEKDLPDKYRKNITRRCRQSIPRRSNNDVHLAIKIKKLFENLEALDLKRDDMTPRTEQKALLNEIQKITEIKQKLAGLSAANFSSV